MAVVQQENATPLRQVSETTSEYDATNVHDAQPPAIPVDAACEADRTMLGEIAALDLVNTTPLEAINLLFAIQQRLRAAAK